MAKVRVYELAKDLNMTNRQLLNKMDELNIEVKSHMSSLEDKTVKTIRNALFGKKKDKADVKVKPSVIRRRKKKVEDAPESAPEIMDIEEDAPAAEEAEVPPAEAVSTPPQSKEEEPESKPADPEPEDVSGSEAEKPQAETEASAPEAPSRKAKPKSKLRKSEPAKIIKPATKTELAEAEMEEAPVQVEEPIEEASPQVVDTPEESEPSAETEAPVEETAAQADPVPETEAIQTSAPEDQAPEEADLPQPGPETEKTEVTEEVKDKAIREAGKKASEQSDAPVENKADDADAKAKKKKKKRKSTPAKIVKVADPTVLENLRKMRAAASEGRSTNSRHSDSGNGRPRPSGGRPAAGRPAAGRPAPGRPSPGGAPGMEPPMPVSDDPRKRGDKRRGSGDDYSGKRKKRKRKSVVEGNALYNTRGRKKRGRKDVRGKKGGFQKTQITTPKAIKRRVKIDEAIELAELAKRMGIKANEMIAKLMAMGVMATVNQTIDFETA
ncbi:MAG: translation initiation factor IF-2 N-terminal domain-containing protein, partial [Desulfobacterales bacterium]|nr:translation initiation factor IF-2 N-terminal domain-containing protein [Desulfobacterales bacterium]